MPHGWIKFGEFWTRSFNGIARLSIIYIINFQRRPFNTNYTDARALRQVEHLVTGYPPKTITHFRLSNAVYNGFGNLKDTTYILSAAHIQRGIGRFCWVPLQPLPPTD